MGTINRKEVYRVRAASQISPIKTMFFIVAAVVFCSVVFAAAPYLPLAWFFQLSAIVIASVFVNKVLKKGTFATIYVLYEDRLVILTRYGLIEKETGEFPFSTSRFCETFIEHNGKKTPFYPDEILKKLLNLKTTS